MFWPSAVYRSFGGFCGSLFIVGSGLSTLETSANPFIATCGPPRLSEFRLELSQSFQAIGSVSTYIPSPPDSTFTLARHLSGPVFSISVNGINML